MRLKFEIAERILSDSPFIFYFRCFLIKDFVERRERIRQQNENSPALVKLTPLSIADQYKNIIFELINNLQMGHHNPDQAVIMQNEMVMTEDDEWLEGDDAPKVFFIMTGQYQV